MIFGVQSYSEGRHKPVQGMEHNWHVWCNTGACEVLESKEYVSWLAEEKNLGFSYRINFANSSAAQIKPGDRLWKLLSDIAKEYEVRVFQLTLQGGYVSWTGAESDLHSFDAISIRMRT